jgi:hypothetical protein
MKNSKRLESINQKIAELTRKQKEIEDQITDSVSKQVAAILIKKHATNIDIPAFLKKVERIVDELNRS